MLCKRLISFHPLSWSLCRQYLCTQKVSGVSNNVADNQDSETSANLKDEDKSLHQDETYQVPTRYDALTEGTFFQMPKDLFDRLYGLYGFEPLQKELFEILDDTSMMVREPYFQLVDYISKTNFSKPVNRYILYGRYGSGKSYILNTLAHYGYQHNFVLVHFTSPSEWMDEPHDKELSETRAGRLDYPLNAAVALKHFKSQNLALLNRLNLRVTDKYTWSIREKTEKGDPLMNVVEHGMARMKHSSDCYAVLLKELKILADSGLCKLMILIDSVNQFYRKPKVLHPDGRNPSVEELTLPRALMKLYKDQNWKNGIVVVSTNDKADTLETRLNSYYPKSLLTDRGFEDFDPFIPIEVKDYSDIEFQSCLDYYISRRFVNRPAAKTTQGAEEMKFLTAKNPLEVYKFCSML